MDLCGLGNGSKVSYKILDSEGPERTETDGEVCVSETKYGGFGYTLWVWEVPKK